VNARVCGECRNLNDTHTARACLDRAECECWVCYRSEVVALRAEISAGGTMRLEGAAAEKFLADMERVETEPQSEQRRQFLKECDELVARNSPLAAAQRALADSKAECERLKAECDRLDNARIEHGSEVFRNAQKALAEAVAAEREACALIAASDALPNGNGSGLVAADARWDGGASAAAAARIARTIRARGPQLSGGVAAQQPERTPIGGQSESDLPPRVGTTSGPDGSTGNGRDSAAPWGPNGEHPGCNYFARDACNKCGAVEPTVTMPGSAVEKVREAIDDAIETFRVVKWDDNPSCARLRAARAALPKGTR
jgi:hypothetical protein